MKKYFKTNDWLYIFWIGLIVKEIQTCFICVNINFCYLEDEANSRCVSLTDSSRCWCFSGKFWKTLEQIPFGTLVPTIGASVYTTETSVHTIGTSIPTTGTFTSNIRTHTTPTRPITVIYNIRWLIFQRPTKQGIRILHCSEDLS